MQQPGTSEPSLMPVPKQSTRREFLANFALAGGLVLGLGGLATRLGQYLFPAEKAISQQEVLVAAADAIPVDRAQTMDILNERVIVVRTADGVKAFSGKCPHLGCNIQWDTNTRQFVCPCHQGIFDANGNVVSGPPPRGLTAFKAEIKEKNVYITVPT